MNGQQLKNSILQMAVQGKLVPQDPNDEPASVLIQRIREEKEKLIKEKKIKKEKNPSYIFRGSDNLHYEKNGDAEPVCVEDQIPFEIPGSWEWGRISLISYLVGNKNNQIQTKSISVEGCIPVVSQGNKLIDGYSDAVEKKIQDLPLVMFGDHTRNVKYVDFPFVIGADGTKFHKILVCNPKYIYYWMYLSASKLKNRGYARHYSLLDQLFIPLPPLSEQERIVAKIETLLPHIDEYNTKASELLVLNDSFPEKLKKSILQEAVQGKLVPQDPSEEPASALLERIREEKARLVKEGMIKKDKNESVIFRMDNSYYEKSNGVERCIDEEIPFEIPNNWIWARIGNLFSLQAGKNITASEIKNSLFDGAFPCYGGNDLRGYVDRYNKEGDFPIIGRQGALCGNIKRATGKFYATEHAVCVSTYMGTDVEWSCLFLEALNLNQYATATAQPGLAVSKINEVMIPVPPLKEQKRICQKYRICLKTIRELL